VYCVKLVFVSGVIGPNSTAEDHDGACHRHVIKTEEIQIEMIQTLDATNNHGLFASKIAFTKML
jgi:hypothetical protein